jgi:hypothetical protein
MNIQQASWRVLGADDFIRLFIKTLENTSKLTEEDRKKLLLMMGDIRIVMILKYQQALKHEKEAGIG